MAQYMIYDLLIVFSSPPMENSHIDHHGFTSWFYLIYITHIDKICDQVGQKIKFLCKPIGFEAQEGAE